MLVTTHFMDEAVRCHRIAFITGGRLMAVDTPQNLKRERHPRGAVGTAPAGGGRPPAGDRRPAVCARVHLHGPVLHALVDSAGTLICGGGGRGGPPTD